MFGGKDAFEAIRMLARKEARALLCPGKDLEMISISSS